MRAIKVIGVVVLAGVAAARAAAQTVTGTPPVDVTGTGGGPLTAEKAPYTTATGATVADPGAISPPEQRLNREETKLEEKGGTMTKGICDGCGVK